MSLFRKHFPGFILVSIDSSLETRLARISVRARPDDFNSADALRNRDEREQKWGLLHALKSADLHIRNENTLEDFSRNVRALLEQIGRDP